MVIRGEQRVRAGAGVAGRIVVRRGCACGCGAGYFGPLDFALEGKFGCLLGQQLPINVIGLRCMFPRGVRTLCSSIPCCDTVVEQQRRHSHAVHNGGGSKRARRCSIAL